MRYFVRSSAIFLVRVVTKVRSPFEERALAALNARVDLGDEIVDLSLDGAHVDLRVGEPRRADDLLGDLARARALVLAGRGGNVYDLIYPLLEFLKLQRAVIERRRQPEAVFNERSPWYMARTCGSVTCDSSMNMRKSFGK